MDAAAIATVAFTSEDRVRDVIRNLNADGFSCTYPRYGAGSRRSSPWARAGVNVLKRRGGGPQLVYVSIVDVDQIRCRCSRPDPQAGAGFRAGHHLAAGTAQAERTQASQLPDRPLRSRTRCPPAAVCRDAGARTGHG